MRLALGTAPPARFHEQLHHPALDAARVIRPGRAIGFGNEYIAVGKHVEPAGVIEAGRVGVHREPGVQPPASSPAGQPLAGAMWTVGMSVGCGGGSAG